MPVTRVLTGVIVAVLLSASSAIAGALEDGEAACNRGDYATALQLCRPLAKHGTADAQVLLGKHVLGGPKCTSGYCPAGGFHQSASPIVSGAARFHRS
jgi:hypothetical protein